jgi:hypothetical protein
VLFVFHFDNFVSCKLNNVTLCDYEAVGGFFDAPTVRGDNPSFEGGNKCGVPPK